MHQLPSIYTLSIGPTIDFSCPLLYLLDGTYLHIYLPTIFTYYLPTRAQIIAPALVLLPVLLPVLPAAVRRHLARSTQNVDICSFVALRKVADPSQLLA